MHYLFVHSGRAWSGTARAFAAAARGLAARGHRVTVAVEPDSTVERILAHSAAVPGRGALFDVEPLTLRGTWLGAARRLRVLARRQHADVVFVHTDREHLVAAAALRLGSRAHLVRRVPAGRTVAMRRSGRVATWLARTCFVFTTEQDLHATLLPKRAYARVVAPLGVGERPAGVDDAPSTDVGGQYIVCVHDASSRSRAATAIRTMAMLAPRHPNVRLVITGEGGYNDDLRMQAAALGVLHHVTFLDDRDDERRVMRNAQLGWVVADADTAVYGMLDLMALGVPVLAGDGTVAERYVLPHITGLLLPPDDAYLAASSVAELLVSDAQRATMGEAARARVLREFPEHEMIDGFEHAAAAVTAQRQR